LVERAKLTTVKLILFEESKLDSVKKTVKKQGLTWKIRMSIFQSPRGKAKELKEPGLSFFAKLSVENGSTDDCHGI